ncbi:MAG: class I SAM-dependent methyltransferase [Acidobacteriota bacterium]
MEFTNCYEDARRADAYARLDFPGTYYLAYRDLPEILSKHARGMKALDFGCGTGRSTRFLTRCGFDAVGVDIASDMLARAREIDPQGDYRLVGDGDLGQLNGRSFDLVLSAFTFDNVPTMEKKIRILQEIRRVLTDGGVFVSLVSSPEIYTHEWASFSTRDFPENRSARSGDMVRIVVTDLDDSRPTEDVVCSDEDYRQAYKRAGLEVVAVYRPLAREDEPYAWVNETRIAPWVIYVLEKC